MAYLLGFLTLPAHVTAIVASELCAARRMWHIKIPGGVMLAIRSGGVGHDKGYGWVLTRQAARR